MIPKTCLRQRPRNANVECVVIVCLSAAADALASPEERITTTHLNGMSSASCCVQLTQVTNNLQLPGADIHLALGPASQKQRLVNKGFERNKVMGALAMFKLATSRLYGPFPAWKPVCANAMPIQGGVGAVKSIQHPHVAELWRC